VAYRRLATLLVALSLASMLTLSHGGAARAGVGWNYGPDTANDTCPGTTVQLCIDNASDGDTVFMFTDAASENIAIGKSVSLKSGNATRYKISFFSFNDQAAPLFGTLAGIEAKHVDVAFRTLGSSVILRNVSVIGSAGQASSMNIDVETSGSVSIESSIVKSVGSLGKGITLLGIPKGGEINFRVLDSRIDGNGNSQSSHGIQLESSSSGVLNVDMFNNSIWDVARSGLAGIFMSVSGTVRADVNVVGNTIEKSGVDGIQQRNLLTAGGAFALDMFNNTFSHAAAFGARLDAGTAVPTKLRAGFNNYFANTSGNQFDGLSKGSSNLAVDPKFVSRSTGDLRLMKASGLINKGQVCSPGGVYTPDAKGTRRVFGSSVDIGAFEQGALANDGIAVLGTDGPDNQNGSAGADILCGYGGADSQKGAASDDFIDGGTGGDVIYGDAGKDRMLGGAGSDTLCANDGQAGDFLDGGKGTDKFRADSGDTKTSVESAAPCNV
jgi:Ca2+-binding RTX toxin-like protein